MELETHLQIAGRLNYVLDADLATILSATEEVGRMLNGLQSALERRLTAS